MGNVYKIHAITTTPRGNDLPFRMSRAARPWALSFTDTEDLVRNILGLIGGSGLIAELAIEGGHGDSSGMDIGADDLALGSRAVSILSQLRGRFTTDGVLVLWGCKTGLAEALLQELAGRLNVRVRAGIMSQATTSGLVGPVRECAPTGGCSTRPPTRQVALCEALEVGFTCVVRRKNAARYPTSTPRLSDLK